MIGEEGKERKGTKKNLITNLANGRVTSVHINEILGKKELRRKQRKEERSGKEDLLTREVKLGAVTSGCRVI